MTGHLKVRLRTAISYWPEIPKVSAETQWLLWKAQCDSDVVTSDFVTWHFQLRQRHAHLWEQPVQSVQKWGALVRAMQVGLTLLKAAEEATAVLPKQRRRLTPGDDLEQRLVWVRFTTAAQGLAEQARSSTIPLDARLPAILPAWQGRTQPKRHELMTAVYALVQLRVWADRLMTDFRQIEVGAKRTSAAGAVEALFAEAVAAADMALVMAGMAGQVNPADGQVVLRYLSAREPSERHDGYIVERSRFAIDAFNLLGQAVCLREVACHPVAVTVRPYLTAFNPWARLATAHGVRELYRQDKPTPAMVVMASIRAALADPANAHRLRTVLAYDAALRQATKGGILRPIGTSSRPPYGAIYLPASRSFVEVGATTIVLPRKRQICLVIPGGEGEPELLTGSFEPVSVWHDV
jgi:hypothetical protein